MLRRYWPVAPLILIGATTLYGPSALFAPAAAAPLLLGAFEQSEALVEPAQGRQIPWDYSDNVLRGPRANCQRRCGYRRTLCTTPPGRRSNCIPQYLKCLRSCPSQLRY